MSPIHLSDLLIIGLYFAAMAAIGTWYSRRARTTESYFVGNRSYPGRVFKGKRMSGRMGNERVTVANLQVVEVRADQDLMLLRGAVPGSRGGTLLIRKRAGVSVQAKSDAAGAQ